MTNGLNLEHKKRLAVETRTVRNDIELHWGTPSHHNKASVHR
jgi:hypothetical protein